MSDIQAGDVVVCVDASDRNSTWPEDSGLLRRDAYYRVLRVVSFGQGVKLKGVRAANPSGHWIDRFRKLNDGTDDAELIARIRKCKPADAVAEIVRQVRTPKPA